MKLQELNKKINRTFNESELKNLCFNLEIDYENLSGNTKSDKIRELILFCQRHNRISELLKNCERLRPNIKWDSQKLSQNIRQRHEPEAVDHDLHKKKQADAQISNQATNSNKWQQKILTHYLPFITAGFLFIGSLLDTINNTVDFITPNITYYGTLVILVFVIVATFYLRFYPLKWAEKDGNLKIHTNLNTKTIFLLFGVVVALWLPRFLINGESITNTAIPQQISSSPTFETEILNSHTEERISREELIVQNNCGSLVSLVTEIAASKPATIEVGSNFSVTANGDIALNDQSINLRQALVEKHDFLVGEVSSISRAFTIETPPNTSREYLFRTVELWEVGEILITIDEEEFIIPYSIRIDISLELISMEESICSTQELTPTPEKDSSIISDDIAQLNPSTLINDEIEMGEIQGFVLKGFYNVPILIIVQGSELLGYQIKILNENESVLTQSLPQQMDLYRIPFTPPIDGEYSILLEATVGEGEFTLSYEQLVEINTSNQVTQLVQNGNANGLIARGSFQDYEIEGEIDIPVKIIIQTAARFDYFIRVFNSQGIELTRSQPVSNNYHEFNFIPSTNGDHVIRLEGIDGYGEYVIAIESE